MLKKIDHIGIAVESLEESKKIFQLLGLQFKGEEEVEDQKVKVAFFQIGEVNIELLEPTSDDSPIKKFLEKKGQGIHHIAYNSDNIEKDLKKFEDEGIALIDKTPRIGAHNKKIAFLHPKSTAKILTEICQ